MSTRVRTYRSAVPTGLQEVHECATAVERVLSLYVTNTTTGNLTFTLGVDRNGTNTPVLYEMLVYGSSAMKDTFEWVPGLFPLTKAEPAASGLGLVGDIVTIQASGVGLEFHLAIEVIE